MGKRYWAFLDKNDIEKAYEYYYILLNLEEKKNTNDIYNVYYHKIKQKANVLYDKMLQLILQAIQNWQTHHGYIFKEEDIEILPNSIFKPGYDSFLRKVLEEIHQVWLYAKEALSGDWENKFFAINYALHLTHYQRLQSEKSISQGTRFLGIGEEEFLPKPPKGLGTEYFADLLFLEDLDIGDEEVDDFLSSLSKGEKYFPEWEKKIKQRASKFNWYKKAQSIQDFLWKRREEVKNRFYPEDWSYSWGVIDKQDVMKIYALEYKISQLLSKGDYLEDDDYVLYNKYYHEALKLSNELIPKLLNIFESWLKLHGYNIKHKNEGFSKILDFMLMGWSELRSALGSASLQDKFRAINIALHVIHGSDQSLVAFGDFEFIPNPEEFTSDDGPAAFDEMWGKTKSMPHSEWQLLDDLTKGKFIPEWEHEMKLRANNINWYKAAKKDILDDLVVNTVNTKAPSFLTNTMGNAADVEEDTIIAYHLTDSPKELMQYLESGKSLIQGRDSGWGDLGPGLYASAVPDLWIGRSRGKWDFLEELSDKEKSILADAIRQHSHLQEDSRFLTAREREFAFRDLKQWEEGLISDGAVVSLAGQPYNIQFWKKEFLEPLGIESSSEPQVVKLELKGKFAELARGLHNITELQALLRAGFDGAYIKGGFSNAPQIVIWDKNAIKNVSV